MRKPSEIKLAFLTSNSCFAGSHSGTSAVSLRANFINIASVNPSDDLGLDVGAVQVTIANTRIWFDQRRAPQRPSG